MRLIFLGSGAFAEPALRWLAGSEHEIALVVTQPSKGSGRGRRTARTPVGAVASELGFEVLGVEDVNEPSFVDRVRSLDVDAGLVIAFGQMLGAEFRETTPGGYLNLHASLLPKYRGAAPINWAIARGERETGCTVFRIVQRMDAGPVLITRSTDIKPQETAGELHDRLATIGVDAIKATIALYADDSCPAGSPQDDQQATRAPKLKKSDGAIDFDLGAAEVVNHIHAMTPWPGATTRFESTTGRWENVTITRARYAEAGSEPGLNPGAVDERLFVAARGGAIEIIDIKPSSGRLMTWGEYVNGRHVVAGDCFVVPAAT